MHILRLIFILLVSLTVSCQAQKSAIPKVFSKTVKSDKKGEPYVLVDGRLFNMSHFAGIDMNMAKPAFTGTADGLQLQFTEPKAVMGIFFGFLPYDDSKHPMPVYRNFSLADSTGKLNIDIKHLTGRYDMIGWVEKGMGSIGYRVVGPEGILLYDGVITFVGTPEGPFAVANTIIDGPTVNQVGPDSCVIAFGTNIPVKAMIEVDRPGTRAMLLAFTDESARTNHEIHLTGLMADTEYRYTVYYGGDQDKQASKFKQSYSFKTAPKAGTRKPFVFAYASDSRAGYGGGERDFAGSNAYIMKKIMGLAKKNDVAFFQFSGDLINGYSDSDSRMKLEYASWKRAVQPFAHYFPVYVSMGNHEAYVYKFKDGTKYGLQIPHFPAADASAEYLFSQEFSLPQNGPVSEDGAWYDPDSEKMDFPSYKENVYHYTYDNVAVIVLNSDYLYTPTTSAIPKVGGGMHGYLMDQQMAWLEKTIAMYEGDAAVDHIFVTQHTPCFPNGGHVGDDMWYRGNNEWRPFIGGKAMKKGILERRDEYLDILVNKSKKVLGILTGDEHNFALTTISPDMQIYPDSGYFAPRIERERTIYQVNNGAAGAPYYAQEQTPWSDHVSGFTTQNALVLFYVEGNKVEMVVRNPDTLEDIMRKVLRD
ncbi:MAG: metallophosphoesterase [Bacteroidia bacterium]